MKSLLLPLLGLLALPTAVESKFYKIDTDLMTDETKISFYISSETQVLNSIGGSETINLWVRCNNSYPEIFFTTPTYNADNTRVGVRWDKDKASFYYWTKSTDSQAFFHPRPKEFAQKLKEKSFLTVQWSPYSSKDRAAKFDLNSQEFKEDISKAIADGCNF
tara:strand:- start:135 stop:620 length:486 start_codon:yes stop_codon:yes gene_type:complete